VFGWPPLPGLEPDESDTSPDETEMVKTEPRPLLRSAAELARYKVMASDGALGQAKDLLIDGRQWRLHGLIVEIRMWREVRLVVIGADRIDRVESARSKVHLNITCDEGQSAREHDLGLAPTW
jgi:hypothetical protein